MARKGTKMLAAVSALAAFAFAGAQAEPRAQQIALKATIEPASADQTGLATWYGESYDGRVTANGDRFDMYGLTAAYSNLPFGSMIDVTDLSNGRHVTLRVNDRPAPGSSGMITVTKAAAANLGFVSSKTAMVSVRVVSVGRQGWAQAAN
jgi:rare lipoprotein A (peptidoglycan hydrolase)